MIEPIIKWSNENEGFLNLISLVLLVLLFPFGKWIVNRIESKLRRSRSEIDIRRIEEIRNELYSNLNYIDPSVDFGPVLIRDDSRDHLYFDGDEVEFEKAKAPPSFKAQLADVSVHGIRTYAGFPTKIKRIEDGKRWCLADEDDPDGVTYRTIGVIPFSSIVAINWHGDPAYPMPHIFCRFEGRSGFPYKTVTYCEKVQIREGRNLYNPVVEADEVIQQKF